MQSGSAGVFYYMRKYNMTPLHSGNIFINKLWQKNNCEKVRPRHTVQQHTCFSDFLLEMALLFYS